MDQLLQEIRTLPSIMGSFVFVEGLGVAATDLPRVLRDKELETFGRSINRVFTLNQTSGVDVTCIEIEYDEAKLFAKSIDADSTILVIGEPTANLALVKMTASMLTAELKVTVEAARHSSFLPEESIPALEEELLPKDHGPLSLPDDTEVLEQALKPTKSPEPAAEVVDPATLLTQGPLAEPLGRLQDALAKAIGPFARIIMRENLEKWTKSGPATGKRIPELIDLLAAEIGNSKLETQFRNDLRSLIS